MSLGCSRSRVSGFQEQVSRSRVPRAGFQGQGSRIRVPGAGFQGQGSRSRVPGAGFQEHLVEAGHECPARLWTRQSEPLKHLA
eukprot:364516-Chlamydomonas_euryale.AAC.10